MSTSKSKRKARKRSRQKRRGVKSLEQRVLNRVGRDKIVEAEDGVKMSDVLEAFVEPYLEVADTEERLRKLMSVAVVAWNAALLPEGERQGMMEKILGAWPEGAREDGRRIIEELMERKARYFSEYRRVVVDFDVAEMGEEFHLVVVSTPHDV